MNTEYEASSHLLRYGKYQARIAGHKINQKIHELIEKSGPLTRPIKLVSSTQTRALETLYNIRLQLNNSLEFETKLVQDTGLSECTYGFVLFFSKLTEEYEKKYNFRFLSDKSKQRIRWLYFVREYLQPIKSGRREHTITIIAGHGNLFTAFYYIIRNFINKKRRLESFSRFLIPAGNMLSHGQTLLYRITGAEPVCLKETISLNEIPITVNHAYLRKDLYYEWAVTHQCKVIKREKTTIGYSLKIVLRLNLKKVAVV